MGWVTSWHPTKEELDACVQCGLCLPACPTFQLTGRESASPRGRLQAMEAAGAGLIAVDDVFADVLDFCLQCRACEVVCPGLVPFGRAMEGARTEVRAQVPGRRGRMRALALGRLLPSRLAMRVVTLLAALVQRLGLSSLIPATMRSSFRGLRRLPMWPARTRGTPTAEEMPRRAALLAGCVMDPWFGEVQRATVDVLNAAGVDVEIPQGQSCCGALAVHDGHAEIATRLASRNAAAFSGFDLVVATAAGCGAHMAGYEQHGAPDVAASVRDVTVVVAAAIEEGRLPQVPATGLLVGVQDPCHLRHAQRVVAAPRAVVTAAGYGVVEIDPDGTCCGAAGTYALSNAEASSSLGRLKAEQVAAAGVDLVVSANPGCEIQLRAHLPSGVEILHPVELYARGLARSKTG